MSDFTWIVLSFTQTLDSMNLDAANIAEIHNPCRVSKVSESRFSAMVPLGANILQTLLKAGQ